MSRLPHIAGIICCMIFSALCAQADDKPRVSLSVSKRTIVQPTEKKVTGDEKGRMQTLIVTAENLTSHALQASSLRWTAIVKKVSGGSLKYTGVETLKLLRSFQTVEIQCGIFEIESRPGLTSIERDRIDYEVVLLVNGTESARAVSTVNFAVLAEKAQTAVNEAEVAKVAKSTNATETKPTEPGIIGAEKMPAQKTTAPVTEAAKPVVELPPLPQQKFDFFNLGGKAGPAVK